MADTVPPWLATMRLITGTEEYAGGADNPIILGWRNEIADRYPEMAEYCKNYTHDSVPWCGLTVAYVMAHNGIRPVFGPADTDKFLWAQAWKQFGSGVTAPQLGDVIVFQSHVTLFERQEGDRFICRGGNQSDSVKETSFPAASCEAIRRPVVVAIRPSRKVFTNITASVFSDDSVAYADVAPGWNNRPGVALPAWISGSRPKVKVTNPTNRLSVVCEIIDQGPWNFTSKKLNLAGDAYWLTGTRPQAESGIDLIGRETNLAGIDLTPAAARAIGLDGLGLVDWKFETTETTMADISFDLASFLRFITEHGDEAKAILTKGTNLFNALYPDQPIGIVSIKPPAAPIEPAVAVVPTVAATATSNGTLDLRAGLTAVLGSLGLSAAGVIGSPIGPDATMTGMLLPLISMGAAALGIPAPVVAIGKSLLSMFAKKLA